MKTYSFEYKCRRCGEFDYNPHTGTERGALWGLWEALGLEIFSQGISVTMHSTHHCADGGMGITDLQGYKVCEEGANEHD